nr:hypothetical protein GCM10020092_096640 [Actinoplanes digitatis]
MPVFVTRTMATKPRSQLAPTAYRAVNDAGGGGAGFGGAGLVVAFSVGFGEAVVVVGRAEDFDGVGEALCAADRVGAADCDAEAAGELQGITEGLFSVSATAMGGCTISGVPSCSSWVGPTARTATQATMTTRSVDAPPMKPYRRRG